MTRLEPGSVAHAAVLADRALLRYLASRERAFLRVVAVVVALLVALAGAVGAAGCGVLRGGGPPPCRPVPSLAGEAGQGGGGACR